MKEWRMLVWMTQLGLSVFIPLAVFAWLGYWLMNRFSLGTWILILCLAFGFKSAFSGFSASLKAMEFMAENGRREKDMLGNKKYRE